MGLRQTLARMAADHAHLMLVEVPGHWQTRVAVEREVLRRGWSLASSPADADVLAVCGAPGPRLAAAVDLTWDQLPGPRVRIEVDSEEDVGPELDRARAALLDGWSHRRDAADRNSGAELLESSHDETRHGDMDHGDMDHGDMDHGAMEMAPGGIPLAEGGEDRDGLEMDVLHVRLGPVLAHWPAGLSLRCALQGDLVTEATAELLDDEVSSGPVSAARHLDAVVDLLSLAGAPDLAARARRLRDAILARDLDQGPEVGRLRRRVRRSVVLRWSLRDLDHLDGPPALSGDTWSRLLRMLDAAEESAYDGVDRQIAEATTDEVASLVVGLDLTAARLVVAGLGPLAVRRGTAATHGG